MSSLVGQRVVITRALHQAEELAEPLRRAGAVPILLPMLAIVPPENTEELERAAAKLACYDWVVFTSANAVEALRRFEGRNAKRVAVIGEATARRASEAGFQVDCIATDSVSEGLAQVLQAQGIAGAKILLPTAAVTRDVLPGQLRNSGAQVDVVEAYRTVMPAEAAEKAAAVFSDSLPDWVTFASSSAVQHLLTAMDAETVERCKLASIGPVTSKTLAKFGLRPTVEAEPHTVPAMVEAMSRLSVRADVPSAL